jgi:hypothetical protein
MNPRDSLNATGITRTARRNCFQGTQRVPTLYMTAAYT